MKASAPIIIIIGFVAALIAGLQLSNKQKPTPARLGTPFGWEVRITPGLSPNGNWKKLSEYPDATKVPREFQGTIEYRAHFATPSVNSVGIYLGQIGEVDKIYINGKFIGQTGGFPPSYENFSDVFREYAVHSSVLNSEANEILVITYSRYVGLKGMKPEVVEVGDHFILQKRQYWKNTLWILVRLGVPALCLFLSLLFIPWFSSKTERPQNAIIPIIGIAAFFYALGNSRVLFHLTSELSAYKTLVISAATGWIFAHMFGIRTCNVRSKWMNGSLIVALVLLPTFMILSPNFQIAITVAKGWIILSLPLSILVTGYTLMNTTEKHTLVKASMIFLTIVTTNDVLHSLHYIQTMIVLDLGFSGLLVTFMTTQIVTYKKGFFELAERRAEMMWSERFFNLARQVAHDIRSPLQSMIFASQELKDHTSPQHKEDSSNPINILQLGLARINSILSRLIGEFKGPFESDGMKSASSGVRLSLVDQAVKDVLTEHQWSDEKQVRFVVQGLDGMPPVWAVFDPVDLQAAISNVIRNATESFERSRLAKNDRVVTVSVSVEDVWFKICVEDNGCGIATENLECIFDRGFTAGKDQGTGLGLFQVKQTLDRIEGKIAIDSKVGVGTKVTLSIPTEKVPSYIAETVEYDANTPVYFVDDDPSVQEFWKSRIARDGLSTGLTFVRSSLKQIASSDLSKGTIVMDHFFRNSSERGLDWFKEKHRGIKGYLCTTAFDDPEVQHEAERLSLKVIPKPLLDRVHFSKIGEARTNS